MIDVVPADQIETIVGVPRHRDRHYGRSVPAESRFYILHSHECRERTPDLRDCAFSHAMAEGVNPDEWPAAAVELRIHDGRLAAV